MKRESSRPASGADREGYYDLLAEVIGKGLGKMGDAYGEAMWAKTACGNFWLSISGLSPEAVFRMAGGKGPFRTAECPRGSACKRGHYAYVEA